MRVLKFAAVLLITGCLSFGQTQGSITGTLTDSSGAAVAGATVTVTNAQTNAVRTGVTNDSGLYSFPDLVPGIYSVRAELKGFRTALRQNIELQVQQTARVDITLQPGDVNQTIEVSAAAQMLSSEDATVGTVIENKRIVDLPLNGRDFLQLVALSPNVTIERDLTLRPRDRKPFLGRALITRQSDTTVLWQFSSIA